jgi:multiphosphoryl transfer protein
MEPGEKVRLVVGIAAKSDEHLEILSNLTDVLGDASEADRLARTRDARDIASRLSSSRAAEPSAGPIARPEDLVNGFDIVIRNPHGLHARPATALGDLAKSFQSTIRLRLDDRVADAKSLICC